MDYFALWWEIHWAIERKTTTAQPELHSCSSCYINDMHITNPTIFVYINDWAITTRSKSMEESLTDDLDIPVKYFHNWRLERSACKTEMACNHLNNRMTKRKRIVNFGNRLLHHNQYPKYRQSFILQTTPNCRAATKLTTRNNNI